MATKFFVELPADEYGNTAMATAVVEAELTTKDDRDFLVPVAPQHFVEGWATGWYRDLFGGWAETDGPARMLTYEEHKALIESLPQEVKEGRGNTVKLKNGETMPMQMVTVMMTSLRSIMESDPIAFYEAVQLARNPEHQLWGSTGAKLHDWAIVESDGSMHDLTRSIIVSAVEGEDMSMSLVSPLAAVS